MTDLAAYLDTTETTQARFAALVQVSQPTVNRWVKRLARPSWDKAAEIEQITGGAVPVSVWAGIQSNPSSDAPQREAS